MTDAVKMANGDGGKLSDLIRTRLLGVHPDEQDLQLDDDDWRVILAALEQAGEPPLSTLQRLGQEFDGEEGLGEALFALSDRLRSTGWLELPDNHAAYEKVVAAFQSLSEARDAG